LKRLAENKLKEEIEMVSRTSRAEMEEVPKLAELEGEEEYHFGKKKRKGKRFL